MSRSYGPSNKLTTQRLDINQTNSHHSPSQMSIESYRRPREEKAQERPPRTDTPLPKASNYLKIMNQLIDGTRASQLRYLRLH